MSPLSSFPRTETVYLRFFGFKCGSRVGAFPEELVHDLPAEAADAPLVQHAVEVLSQQLVLLLRHHARRPETCGDVKRDCLVG